MQTSTGTVAANLAKFRGGSLKPPPLGKAHRLIAVHGGVRYTVRLLSQAYNPVCIQVISQPRLAVGKSHIGTARVHGSKCLLTVKAKGVAPQRILFSSKHSAMSHACHLAGVVLPWAIGKGRGRKARGASPIG